MADIDFLKRQYYVSALGLTEAQAARMTINDLEHEFFSTASPTISGIGSPEGVIAAPVSSYYTDTAITNGAMRWAKKTGTGNTGWECVEGDTGWRKVVGWTGGTLDYGTMPSGMAPQAGISGGIYFRRVGVEVHLNIVGAVATGWSQNLLIPGRFAPGGVPYPVIMSYCKQGGADTIAFNKIGATTAFLSYPSGALIATPDSSFASSLQWITRESWPATLPGTAAV